MKKVSIVLFQLGILFITLIVLLIAAFILPVVARDFATETPEWAYLQYPLLIAIYVTLIPFLVAIFQAFKLSRLIQLNQVFSILDSRQLITRLVAQLQDHNIFAFVSPVFRLPGAFAPGAQSTQSRQFCLVNPAWCRF